MLTIVRIQPEYLVKQSKGKIGTCTQCGEAYPVMQGDVCVGCRDGMPFETVAG